MKPIFLGVNIDHVATLREVRGTRYPDPIQAMFLAELGGADGITVHLREDRRHIQERDVALIHALTNTRLNLECAITPWMIDYALNLKPAHVCFVPEKRQELTTEGGLDVIQHFEDVTSATRRLQAEGICVSLFIDADLQQIEAACKTGARAIEIHTGGYADAKDEVMRLKELSRIVQAVATADQLGLIVNAGHGLNYHNVEDIAAIAEINELNIGHSIVAQALFIGFKEAVAQMKMLMIAARSHRTDAKKST